MIRTDCEGVDGEASVSEKESAKFKDGGTGEDGNPGKDLPWISCGISEAGKISAQLPQ